MATRCENSISGDSEGRTWGPSPTAAIEEYCNLNPSSSFADSTIWLLQLRWNNLRERYTYSRRELRLRIWLAVDSEFGDLVQRPTRPARERNSLSSSPGGCRTDTS